MRFSLVRGALCAAAALTLALPALADTKLTPQQRLMARRAAELDAYRKLGETIYGFQISSKTTVKDFVTENDTIRSGFTAFIRGIRIVGDPVYNPDGTVEVTAAVTLQQVVRTLKQLRRTSYTGDQVTEESIDQISINVKQKVITATGYGAPPPAKKLEEPDFTGKNVPPPAEVIPTEKRRWIYKPSPTAGLPGWEGVTGQGRLMAVRAAELDAIRKLGETIYGIRLSSRTTVKDFVTQNDEIKSRMEAFIRGTKYLGPVKYNADGTAEVHMGVTLAQVIRQIQTLSKREYGAGGEFKDVTLEKVKTFTKETLIEANGAGAPNPRFTLKGARFIGWEALSGNNARFKLTTIRAAEQVAARRFGERTAGLQILSGTYVKDFVAENDTILGRMETFIRGIKPVGDIVFYSDGSVEVQQGATWVQLIAHAQTLVRTEMDATGITQEELIKRIRIFEKEHFFVERGEGALPSQEPFFVMGPTPPPPEAEKPDWVGKTFRATGMGAPRPGTEGPQAKLLAKRAAELDAYRKLTEQVYGLALRSNTTVKDFVTENDTIESATAAFIRGAKVVDSKENPDGTVEVTIEIALGELYTILAKNL